MGRFSSGRKNGIFYVAPSTAVIVAAQLMHTLQNTCICHALSYHAGGYIFLSYLYSIYSAVHGGRAVVYAQGESEYITHV